MKGKRIRRWILITPGLCLMLGITIYPFLYALYTSLHKLHLSRGYKLTFVGLDNYIRAFQNPLFYQAWTTTFFFIIIGVSAQLCIGLLIALLVAEQMHKRSLVGAIFKGSFPISMMIPGVVVGWFWLYLYNPSWGILNQLLKMVNFPQLQWISDPSIALLSVIIVDIWQWTPLMFLILLTGITTLPEEVLEAAQIDGASRLQMLSHIIVPMIKPFILLSLLIRIMDAIKIFDPIFVLTKGGPGNTTEVITLFAYKISFRRFRFGQGAALSTIILITIILVSQIIIALLKSERKEGI